MDVTRPIFSGACAICSNENCQVWHYGGPCPHAITQAPNYCPHCGKAIALPRQEPTR